MASLQCSKCEEGIHYHSLPQDIEYIYFSDAIWKKICNTKFDKNNKSMDKSGIYPKMYRSSTIENDYSGQFTKLWKCPKCETLHFFSDSGNVNKVFVSEDETDPIDYTEEGFMFGDYLWADITDKDISNERLETIKPSYYVRLNSDRIVMSESLDFKNCRYYRLYLPEWMKNE